MVFPLNAELYAIDGRVYRRNPYQPGSSHKTAVDYGDTPDIYGDEEDDGFDCAIDNPTTDARASPEDFHPEPIQQHTKVEKRKTTNKNSKQQQQQQQQGNEREKQTTATVAQVCEEDERVSYDGKKWTASVDFPSELIGKLIGYKGRTRMDIEQTCQCRLKAPREGQKGPVEITSYVSLECVQLALDRIDYIQGNTKRQYTHFLAFPCNHPTLVEAAQQLQIDLMESPEVPIPSKHEALFMSPNKLHLTLAMLRLGSGDVMQKAKAVLEKVVQEIKSSGQILEADIRGLSIMNDDPSEVDVLYADVHGQNVQKTADKINKMFVDEGLAEDESVDDVSTTATRVKLHMTVMNSKYLANATNTKRKTFDASAILDEFQDYFFGTVILDKVSICSLNSTDPNTGFYQQVAQLSL